MSSLPSPTSRTAQYCEFNDGRLKGGFTLGGKASPGDPRFRFTDPDGCELAVWSDR